MQTVPNFKNFKFDKFGITFQLKAFPKFIKESCKKVAKKPLFYMTNQVFGIEEKVFLENQLGGFQGKGFANKKIKFLLAVYKTGKTVKPFLQLRPHLMPYLLQWTIQRQIGKQKEIKL